jgi:hypothetical protein
VCIELDESVEIRLIGTGRSVSVPYDYDITSAAGANFTIRPPAHATAAEAQAARICIRRGHDVASMRTIRARRAATAQHKP